MEVIKAPHRIPIHSPNRVFLAGSIEMGKAVDWQTRVTEALSHLNVTICNPRRDDWDSSWKTDLTNPKFVEQVTWELSAIEKADLVAMYFDPPTMSPISLLELGLMSARPTDIIVCCPPGFWRKGNIDVLCQRYDIRQVDTLEQLIESVVKEFTPLPTGR